MGKGKHVASRIRTGRAAGHGNTAMRGYRCGSRRRYTRPSRALVGFAGEEHLKWRGSHKAYADTRGSGIALPNFVSKSVFGTRRLRAVPSQWCWVRTKAARQRAPMLPNHQPGESGLLLQFLQSVECSRPCAATIRHREHQVAPRSMSAMHSQDL